MDARGYGKVEGVCSPTADPSNEKSAHWLSTLVVNLNSKMPLCPINIPLPNGAQMPALGLGTWQATDDSGLDAALDIALETGYRQIDTAEIYGVEKIVGNVLKRWLDSGKIRREDLFIVTKLPVYGNRQSSVEKYIKKSLADLQLDYVDLYLVHNAVGMSEVEKPGEIPVLDKTTDIIGVWRGMEAQVDAGRTKAIGLSNFNEKQIQRILDIARIKPVNLQIELHVYFQQRPLVEFCRKNNISVTAYAPLGSRHMNDFLLNNFGGKIRFKLPNLLQDETVLLVAKKHNKTPAQVLIRHILQRGISTIPKSATPERVVSNFQVFDFELDKADVEALDKLDQGEDGRGFDFKPFGFHEHPEYPW